MTNSNERPVKSPMLGLTVPEVTSRQMLESGQGNLLPPELESAQLVSKAAVMAHLEVNIGILIDRVKSNL